MTPAITAVKKAKIPFTVHQYEHDTNNTNFGDEAVEKLGVPAQQVFKTLVVQTDNNALVVNVVPVQCRLDLKAVAKACGCKKAEMADKNLVQRTTGYVLGGVSALGQKKQLTTLIDNSAKNIETIFISAGKRGLELELSALNLADLTRGRFASITA